MEQKHSVPERKGDSVVILMTAPDKQGAAFCYGALQALRDRGVLYNAQNIIAAGTSNLVLFHLFDALRNLQVAEKKDPIGAKWLAFNDTKQCDVMRTNMLPSLCNTLETPQEKIFLFSRIMSPFSWLSSWAYEVEKYVSRRFDDIADSTLLYSVDPYGERQTFPALTMVGSPPGSAKQIAFSTFSASGAYETQTAKVYGPASKDRFSDICFGLGMTERIGRLFSTDETVGEVSCCMRFNPIPWEIANLFFLKSRLNFSRDGLDSRRLILIDGYTDSKSYRQASPPVQNAAQTTVQNILSAPDCKQESIRAYRSFVIQQFDPGYSIAARHGSTICARPLYRQFRKTPNWMCGLERSEVELASNWGYLLTHKMLCDDVNEANLPFPDAKTSPFNLKSILFGTDIEHGSLANEARPHARLIAPSGRTEYAPLDAVV
jgi:hypothetical protein